MGRPILGIGASACRRAGVRAARRTERVGIPATPVHRAPSRPSRSLPEMGHPFQGAPLREGKSPFGFPKSETDWHGAGPREGIPSRGPPPFEGSPRSGSWHDSGSNHEQSAQRREGPASGRPAQPLRAALGLRRGRHGHAEAAVQARRQLERGGPAVRLLPPSRSRLRSCVSASERSERARPTAAFACPWRPLRKPDRARTRSTHGWQCAGAEPKRSRSHEPFDLGTPGAHR
jgi:hypothetical protein